jgi:outer membrane immunogenic protein
MSFYRTMTAAAVAAAAMFSAAAPASAAPGDVYNWSGFYVGAVGSGGLFTVEQEDYWCFEACNAPTLQEWGASIGVQGGYNWQNGNLVFGVVGDWSTGFENEETVLFNSDPDPDGVEWNSQWNSYGTLRGRAGLGVGNALVFATGGIAIVDVDYSAREFQNSVTDCTVEDCAAVNDTLVGFAGGVGTGFPIANNVNMTIEYLYIGLPWEKDRWSVSEISQPGTDDYVSWTTSAHLVRLGVAWEFN